MLWWFKISLFIELRRLLQNIDFFFFLHDLYFNVFIKIIILLSIYGQNFFFFRLINRVCIMLNGCIEKSFKIHSLSATWNQSNSLGAIMFTSGYAYLVFYPDHIQIQKVLVKRLLIQSWTIHRYILVVEWRCQYLKIACFDFRFLLHHNKIDNNCISQFLHIDTLSFDDYYGLRCCILKWISTFRSTIYSLNKS